MLVTRPLKLDIPPYGVLAAESMHDIRFEMQPERHDFHEIYYLLAGEALYYQGDGAPAASLSEGTCYAISPGVTHRIEDRTQSTMLLLCFSRTFIAGTPHRQALWDALTTRQNPVLRPDLIARTQVERSLRSILAEQKSQHLGAEALIESEGLRILATLSRLPDRPLEMAAEQRVAHVIELVDRLYFEPWDLDAAAVRAQLSRRRFSALFRTLAGASFVEYLTETRLTHAAGLLQQGGSSIAGAAFVTGFNDLSHFYRVFRRRFGHPPGEWMRRVDGD